MTSRLLAILALIVLNAFFVAAEFALVRSRRTRLEAMVRTGDRMARLALRASSNISRMLSASQLGVSLASLGLGWIAEDTLGVMLGGAAAELSGVAEMIVRLGIAGVIAFATLTYLHVVLGELTPRAAALNSPERVARLLSPPLLLFAWLTTPFLWIVHRSAEVLMRITGRTSSKVEETVHSPEELRLLVEQSQEGGALQPADADMIDAVFEFSEKTAREVMTPRTEIVALDVAAPLPEVLRVVDESAFSRYPVYEESIDDIIGLVLTKDLLKGLIPAAARGLDPSATPAAGPAQPFTLRSLLRPVHVIPGSREVEDVLADFKRLKEHMAIVLDEYGGTAGVITMEDLLEEIVGEILDEYDTPEDLDEPVLTRGGETVVAGSTNIGELNDHFGLAVPDSDATTIGGFVFGILGRLPQPGDRVIAGGAIFTVKSMEGRKIDMLAVDLHSAGDRRSSERERQAAGTEAAPR